MARRRRWRPLRSSALLKSPTDPQRDRGEFPHQHLHFARADGLVRVHARLANYDFASVRPTGFFWAGVDPALRLSSPNVKYRDFRYVIPFIVQLGL